jgi:hypothetical protein
MIQFGEILYSILTGYGKLMNLLLNVCERDLYEACVAKYLCDAFPIHNGMQWGNALTPLLFNLALEFATHWEGPKNQDGLKFCGTHPLLVYADDENLMRGKLDVI